MTLILGIILPVVMFLATLPLKATLVLVKAQLVALQAMAKRADIAEKLGLGDESRAVRETAKATAKVGVSTAKLGVKSVKAGVKTVKLGAKTVKLGVKSIKILIKTLKLLIKALTFIINLLKSLASLLVFLVSTFGIVFIVILIVLVVLLGGMVVIGNNIDFSSGTGTSNSNQVVTSQVSGSSAPSANAQEWLQKCEEMGNWYVNNVSSYGGSTVCDILGGKNVRTDCTGYIGACLGLAGFIDYTGTGSAEGSSSYIGETSFVKKLEEKGWKHYTAGEGFQWKSGDIAAINDGTGNHHHVELVVSVEGDTLYHFGWGSTKSEYPSGSCKVSEFKHGSKSKGYKYYTDCLRLE